MSHVDRKIQVLCDNYRDNHYAKEAQKDVQAMRTKANQIGVGATTLAFVGNELVRISNRSPLFKLKPQNVLFWLAAPTYVARQAYNSDAEKRIEQMWNVHKNRVDRGLKGTFKSSGQHESLELQESNFIMPTMNLSWDNLFEGAELRGRFTNPFLRWHEVYQKYPDMLSDVDNHEVHENR
jgi:hypothetical protein